MNYNVDNQNGSKNQNKSWFQNWRVKLIAIVIIVFVAGNFITNKINESSASKTILQPKTLEAQTQTSINCRQLEKGAVAKVLVVKINNTGPESYNDISVKIIGYDAMGNITKEKYTTFSRVLGPYQSFSKPITLPNRVTRCDCILENIR